MDWIEAINLRGERRSKYVGGGVGRGRGGGGGGGGGVEENVGRVFNNAPREEASQLELVL